MARHYWPDVTEGCVLQDGTRKMTAALDMDSHKITHVTDPVDDQDAATKKFVVDSIAGQLLSDIADVDDYGPAGETHLGEVATVVTDGDGGSKIGWAACGIKTSDLTLTVAASGGDYATIAGALAGIPTGSFARNVIISLEGDKNNPITYSEQLTFNNPTSNGKALILRPTSASADVRTPVVTCQAGGSTTVVKIAKTALSGTVAGDWAGCAMTVAQGQGAACVGQQRVVDGNGAVENGTDWDFTVTSAFGSAIGAACKVVIDSIIVGDGSSTAVSHTAGKVRIEDISTSGRWTVDGGAAQVGPLLHIDRATMAAGAETTAIVAAHNSGVVTFGSSTHCVVAGAARALSLQNAAKVLCFPTSASIYLAGGGTNLVNLIAGAMMAACNFSGDCNAGSWGAQMSADVGSVISVYSWTMYGSAAGTKTLMATNNSTIRYQTPAGHTVVDSAATEGQISHY